MEKRDQRAGEPGAGVAALVVCLSAGVRRLVKRGLILSVVPGVLGLGGASAGAQVLSKHQHRARRETNASRQARIQRTIENTYSSTLR